jgi:hypothetical protein
VKGVRALTGVVLLLVALDPAAGAMARAADRVQEIPLEPTPQGSHLLAYGCLAVGVGLIAGSFVLANKADDTYRDYMNATDPGSIEQLYDQTARYDRYSSAALIAGEVAVAAGLYLRFLRNPAPARFLLSANHERCALVWRF